MVAIYHKKNIIEIPKKGILNFHPSYLPHNAGKHPNFWNLIEERPYGVTIHFIDENIDSGDIVFQRQIKVEWEDNGETLYEKALKTIYELFCDSYPLIREGNYTRKKQLKSDGSFHYGKEMFEKAKLDLNQKCTIREILNLLRAKTFPPYEGCKFQDKGSEYEVTVKIKNITPPEDY